MYIDMSEINSNKMDDIKKSEELVEVVEEKVSMPDGLIKVSNRCKSCKNIFLLSSILYHITRNETCKIQYSEIEVDAFRQWSKQRKRAKRSSSEKWEKKLYDPTLILKIGKFC